MIVSNSSQLLFDGFFNGSFTLLLFFKFIQIRCRHIGTFCDTHPTLITRALGAFACLLELPAFVVSTFLRRCHRISSSLNPQV